MNNGVDARTVLATATKVGGQSGFDESAFGIVGFGTYECNECRAHLRIGANDAFGLVVGIEYGSACAGDGLADIAFAGADAAGQGDALWHVDVVGLIRVRRAMNPR